ncbi:glycosyltransferase family 2 protein [Vibrio sp. ZSDZ65]|uniref:Glycosyltransferase family 2 protein n=1 Tax=Vibrio qingdaonensis TaxID=2829491 RepID=A0A9X3CRC4_9VIBR|nr:glycosyltransferase family 2 protein [Vibrio qingdaonensis]MCW8348119.1 glycosyltransferase family 2 protein [Vibrio qingdaonensis]
MKQNNDFTLSILVPVYNEERSIAPFIQTLYSSLDSIKANLDVVFVNDGSSDNTRLAIEAVMASDSQVSLVNLARNFGKEAAMTAGLDYVKGDACVIMDVDLQDPPDVILEFVELWQTKQWDTIYGVRVDRSKDTWFKRLTAGGFYRFFNWVTSETKIPENAGDFRLIDRVVIDALRQLPERNRFMKGLMAWSAFRSTGVQFQRPKRHCGETKFNYWKLWNFAVDGIFSFTAWPLRIWGFIGCAISCLAFVFMLKIIIGATFFDVKTPGYASTISVVLFLGGIQLISLGIIGGYISRMYRELKQRPIYLVEGVYGRYGNEQGSQGMNLDQSNHQVKKAS